MSKKLERAALKTAAVIKKQSIQHGWDNLLDTCKLIGLSVAFLASASPLAAQTLALTESKGTGGTISTSVRKTTTPRHKIQVREYDGRTPDTYKMRNGTVLDVFQTEDARYYVIRPNGKKYFPKSLNR